jgi:hypothetical protein
MYHWHAELGADGKDYRANFVHTPFPEIPSSLSARGFEARGRKSAPLRFSSPRPCELSHPSEFLSGD